MDEKLLTAQELAAKLDVDPETVRRMCKTGKWPHTKIGRLYRFTEDHYQAITAPPVVEQKPRTQRKNIAHLLRSA
jgi:excisionase family DNA binding protein